MEHRFFLPSHHHICNDKQIVFECIPMHPITYILNMFLLNLQAQTSMDIVIRRCPFLSRVPQAFLQQTRKSLVVYAQRCPVMMDLASKPLARSVCSSSSSFQKTEETSTSNDETSTSNEGELFHHDPCYMR